LTLRVVSYSGNSGGIDSEKRKRWSQGAFALSFALRSAESAFKELRYMTSIFELFKIGIGPSSSHTVGPMRAAKRFVDELEARAQLGQTDGINVELYGSLALTGKGHGTDRALILGLTGEVPDLVEPGTIDFKLSQIRERRSLNLLGTVAVCFDPETDIVYKKTEVLPGHSNGMRFVARDSRGNELATRVFYSIGGGFILGEGEQAVQRSIAREVPYPFASAAELLRLCVGHQKSIWSIVLENEKTWRSESDVRHRLGRIWMAMKDCTHRGMITEGVLPGGLNVRRRAPELYRSLFWRSTPNPLDVMDWINLFAIAVNEENAAGGRVVTAPTNGAAGVVPAVAHYYHKFVAAADDEGVYRYLLAAGAIGVLYKENASISGAEVGCQGEVGVACSMAAAGLVAAMNGTNEQVEHAAEIGMEHNLGMTCDPIGGLVQIPCIERNAFGAVKAVNAARMAMNEEGEHKVSLDQVIRTMYETGRDMQVRYKETSLGGLAVNVVEC
jgi:L-serine dehydratase